MLLQRKIDRAMKWSKERRMRADGLDPEEEEIKEELRKHSSNKEDLPSMEDLRAEALADCEPCDKKDYRAMVTSAYLMFVPACMLAIGAICLFAYWFMGGFR